MHHTYRWLDAPPRLFGLALTHWLGLIAALCAGYGAVRLLGIPVKVALSAGVFLVGLPAMLAYLSDGEGPQLGRLARDALVWLIARCASERTGVNDPRRLLSVAAIGEDGLAIRTDGTCLRYLEVLAAPNPLAADEQANEQLTDALGGVLARLGPGQSLQLYVQARPLSMQELLAGEAHAVALAANSIQDERPELAGAMRRLHQCAEDSLQTHSQTVAAMSMRYVIVVPWTEKRERFARRQRGSPELLQCAAGEHAQQESLAHAHGIQRDLQTLGLDVRLLDGPGVLELLADRFDPGRRARGGVPVSFMRPDALGLPAPGEPSSVTLDRQQALQEAVCRAVLDFRERDHALIGDGAEQMSCIAGVPEQTWFGWLLHAMQAPRPFSLSMHVTATDRLRERQAQRRRWRRLRGANIGTERHGRPVDPRAEEQEHEAQELSRELAVSSGAGIYRMSVYLQLRENGPDPDPGMVLSDARAVARALTVISDARLDPGTFAQRSLWQSSLPLACDTARRTRKYLSRNVADSWPIVSTSASCPSGIPLGYAQPGRTLERLDPFDELHTNHMLVVAGKSGTGKTMTVKLLLARALAKGLRATVIDRAGHFRFLADLLPGAVEVSLGRSENRQALCPWDVPDPAHVEQSKIDFLLALHNLLLVRQDGKGRTLGDLEENLLSVGIRDVYARCTLTGEQPRELLLQEELYRRHEHETAAGASDIAATLRNLALRLNNYTGDGPYAYIADWPSTLPEDSPMVIYDTRAIPDSRKAAILFAVCEHTTQRLETEQATQLTQEHTGQEWAGRHALIIDEAWKLMQSAGTGRWFNELARRSRHLALWLIVISQQLTDFDNPHGRALLDNASMHILLAQEAKETASMRDALGLTEGQAQAIRALRTSKGQYATAFLINGRGSTTIQILVSAAEYWIATSDAAHDEHTRRRALRQAGGEPWKALGLLCDPEWQTGRR